MSITFDGSLNRDPIREYKRHFCSSGLPSSLQQPECQSRGPREILREQQKQMDVFICFRYRLEKIENSLVNIRS
ncbi:hypothetical protein RUM43_008617, partial [Polyplax serrata]